MTQTLFKEGTFFHSIILEGLNKNIENLLQFKSFSEDVLQIASQFSQKIGNCTRQHFKKYKAKQTDNKNQSTLILTRFLLETLGELHKKITTITKKIQNQIIQPLQQFVSSHMQTNKQALQKSQQMLNQIQSNSSLLTEITKNFTNTMTDFNQTQKSQLKKVYEHQMEECNWKWHQIKKSYREILVQSDSANSSRLTFTKRLQLRLLNQLNCLLYSDIISKRLIEYEEVEQQNQDFSIEIKEQIRQFFGKTNLFQESIQQTITSSKNIKQSLQQEKIDQFIEIFTSRYNINYQNDAYQFARNLVLDKQKWAKYFLQKLKSNIHTQIKLPIVKFHELTTIIKYLFASAVENNDNQDILYNILYISYRFNNNRHYMIKQVGKYTDFWHDANKWHQIIDYIIQNKQIKSIKAYSKRDIVINWWKKGQKSMKNIKQSQKQIKTQKIITQLKYYQIICQINYYMAKLQLKQDFIFNFVTEIAQIYNIGKENVQRLLKFHYFHTKNNKNTLSSAILRKKRIQQKYKFIDKVTDKSAICVGKCLKYLPLDAKLVNLRLVCKKWNKKLEYKIYSRFLIGEKDCNIVNMYRLKIYTSISQLPYDKDIYLKMIKQLPQITEHTDIINLDVKRSLSWNQNLRPTLFEVLKTFAFYNSNTGYLQGMNYLCQNILKLTTESFQIYKIFENLMNKQFCGLYSPSFEDLRIKIYQFMRILQRQSPKLYDHFITQKIQGEHFLLPWAITLWGEVSGDLCFILWDGFLVKGWKWWIKTGIWLLKKLQPELLQMSFEQLMKCFSDLNSTILSSSKDQLKQFGINFQNVKEQVNLIKVQANTLKQLQKQYSIKVSMVKQYLNKIKEN